MDAYIFLYDKLMLEQFYSKVAPSISFVSYGYVEARLYAKIATGRKRGYNETGEKVYYISPKKSTVNGKTYGGIFLFKDIELYEHKYFAAFGSSLDVLRQPTADDMFLIKKMDAIPIYFDSLAQMQQHNYEEGNPVECLVAVVNPLNPTMIVNRWHNAWGVATGYFIKMYYENKRNEVKRL